MRTKERQIIENLENFDYHLFGSNVVGVGYGLKEVDGKLTDELSIKFLVKEKKPVSDLRDGELLPSVLNLSYISEQIKTDVVESSIELVSCGNIPDRDSNSSGNKSRTRPIKGGISAINATDFSNAAGCTLGGVFRDQYDGMAVGITCLHCVTSKDFANETINNTKDSSLLGNAVINPSSLDGGSVANDTIGYVKRIVPLSRSSVSYVDLAIISLKQSVVGEGSDEFYGLPFTAPFLFASTEEIDQALANGNPLYVSGRTSGPINLTDPQIKVTSYVSTATVTYPDNYGHTMGDILELKYVTSGGQICSETVVAGGDSGAMLLGSFGGEIKIVGLVFGTSAQGGGTFACRIDRIREIGCIGQFGIKIDNDWKRTDILDGTSAQPTPGKVKFEYILEPEEDSYRIQPSQTLKNTAVLRKPRPNGTVEQKYLHLLGQSSGGTFKSPSSQNPPDSRVEIIEPETESLVSKYMICGSDPSGSANEEGFNPNVQPPVNPFPTGGSGIQPPQDITGILNVSMSISTNEIQHKNFNDIVGLNLNNWHVVDQTGNLDPCAYPPSYGKFGPGYGHIWDGYTLPSPHVNGNCGSDGTSINGMETNGKAHFWPQVQLVRGYTQDTHAKVKAFDSSNQGYIYHVIYKTNN